MYDYKTQSCDLFLACQRLGDIVFVLDGSGSIGKENFERSKVMMKKIIKAFPQEKGHRHAAVVYGKSPSIKFNTITSDAKLVKTSELLKYADELTYPHSVLTRIIKALRYVQRKVFFRTENAQRMKVRRRS